MAGNNNNRNRNINNNNGRGKNYLSEQAKSDILIAMQNFIKQSIANDKNYSSTVTSIFPSLAMLGKNGALKFNGLKYNDSQSSDQVLENSLGTTPILYSLTHRIDFGKLYGKGYQLINGEHVPFLGDIYDEYELKQLIQDVNAKTYKEYYNVNLPDTSRDDYYQVVIEVLAESLALYSLIVCAWSFQNMKESKYKILGHEGYLANIFSQMGWIQQGVLDYPYVEMANPNNKYRVPFQLNYSNAEWLQKVIAKLDAVWLPEKTAQFWREMFGGVFMLTPHEDVDRGAIQLVKFIPQFTIDFDNLDSDDDLYNKLFYSDTDKDEFEAVLDALSSSINSRLSMYPWLQATLESLGCNFHGFKYYVDGSGNIASDKCDDFTRALTSKNVNIVYDSTNDIRNALQSISLINYRYLLAEEESEHNLAYLYMPYELCTQNKFAPMMKPLFNSFMVSDIRNTMLANKTNFAALLKGNVDLPILHILVASLDTTTRDPNVEKNVQVRLLVSPGFRYYFNISASVSLASICTYYDILQDCCTIPLTKVVLKGSQGSDVTQIISQASLWPVECLSMYDGYDPTGYEDIDRARAARRYLLIFDYDNKDSSGNNRNKNKNKQRKDNNNNEEKSTNNKNNPSNNNNNTYGDQNV